MDLEVYEYHWPTVYNCYSGINVEDLRKVYMLFIAITNEL
jgi:hypothetical protein